MWGMVANWLSAQGGGTASWEYNLPPNHYVIAQCALNTFINTTGSSAINVYSYTTSDGNIVTLSYPNQPPGVWGQGILNVTFGLYAYGSFSTGNAWIFLW
jgi:hypothetical protein